MSVPGSRPVVAADDPAPPGRQSETTGQTEARSGELGDRIRLLAALLEPVAFDPDQDADPTWRKVSQSRALAHAAKVLAVGYVRPPVDDGAIERLAEDWRTREVADFGVHQGCTLEPWDRCSPGTQRWYIGHARLVLAALRGGEQ